MTWRVNRSCIQLHEMGPKLVVITSYELENEFAGELTLVAMRVPEEQMDGCIRGGVEFVRIRVPKVEGHYTGTGDFVSACTLAWTHILPNDLPQALLRTIASMQCVLQRTGYQAGGRSYFIVLWEEG